MLGCWLWEEGDWVFIEDYVLNVEDSCVFSLDKVTWEYESHLLEQHNTRLVNNGGNLRERERFWLH